jgi:hypothetical protein
MHVDRGADLMDLYVDWCSARVAERFLSLSPDEVWQRAEALGVTAARTDGLAVQIEMARSLATELARELGLPPFAEWCATHARDPSPYDRDLLR